MLSEPVIIDLQPAQFGPSESLLARHAGLSASTWRYPSGVAGLRIANGLGHIDLLPFQGQQIWDAVFLGRRLTMGSMFDQPLPTDDFMGSYGAFFLHCGATAMGDPGPTDTHPPHGELPLAAYEQAQLIVGQDDAGAFMGLTGRYRHRVAFSHHYLAEPTLLLHAGTSRIVAQMRLRNLRHQPMELMYLAHINFRPIDGAVLAESVPAGPGHIRVRPALPPPFVPSEEHRRLVSRMMASPEDHRQIDARRAIDPELVLSLDCRADAEGWAYAMQLLPDGSADFVSHRPDQLDHALRWLCQTPSERALGLLLPATAEADGYTAEKAKGHLRLLPSQSEFRCNLEFGALNPPQAVAMARRIEAIVARPGPLPRS
jgi:hypothetical protein